MQPLFAPLYNAYGYLDWAFVGYVGPHTYFDSHLTGPSDADFGDDRVAGACHLCGDLLLARTIDKGEEPELDDDADDADSNCSEHMTLHYLESSAPTPSSISTQGSQQRRDGWEEFDQCSCCERHLPGINDSSDTWCENDRCQDANCTQLHMCLMCSEQICGCCGTTMGGYFYNLFHCYDCAAPENGGCRYCNP